MAKREKSSGDFFIGDTNFGIDAGKSRWDLRPHPDGGLLLSVDVHGSQETYRRITAEEGSVWQWTLSPPQFYLRNYPVAAPAKGKPVKARLTADDAGNYDVALYLMEHNAVAAVRIEVAEDRLAGALAAD